MQLTTYLFFKTSLHVSASYRNYIQYVLFLKILILPQYINYFHNCAAIYCFLIYIYTVLLLWYEDAIIIRP
jgi:hypothetical protein